MIDRIQLILVMAVAVFMCSFRASGADAINAALVTPDQAAKLTASNEEGFTGAVLYLREGEFEVARKAAGLIVEAGLALYYWIEVGRNTHLATAHPEWMASVQTHTEWRREFPDFPKESATQVVKTYPWVPVLYQESFPAHLERVRALLKGLPGARGLFLNDLQGAPSACGCGNNRCRWTADYGSRTTATTIGPNAAADFVSAVQKAAPGLEVIPVWTTECDEHEPACGGVPCFTGRCWKEYARQIAPVEKLSRRLGVMLPPAVSDRSILSPSANALRSFTEVLPANRGPEIASGRLIAVVPGAELAAGELKRQRGLCRAAGVTNTIVSLTKIDQSWEPRLFDLPKR